MTGREFRSWRRSQEITQQVVANSVNCNVSTISRWEKGELNLTTILYEKILKFYNNQMVVSNGQFSPKPLNSGQRKPL